VWVSVSGSRGEQGGGSQHDSSMHQIYLVEAAARTTGSKATAVSLLLRTLCEGHMGTDQPNTMLH